MSHSNYHSGAIIADWQKKASEQRPKGPIANLVPDFPFPRVNRWNVNAKAFTSVDEAVLVPDSPLPRVNRWNIDSKAYTSVFEAKLGSRFSLT